MTGRSGTYGRVRAEAVDAIAKFWRLASPKCMWPLTDGSEYSHGGGLEINHIYGGGSQERKGMPVYNLCKAVVSGEYDLSRLNLLCANHNQDSIWSFMKILLRVTGRPYAPGLDFAMLMVWDETFRMVFDFPTDETYWHDFERRAGAGR